MTDEADKKKPAKKKRRRQGEDGGHKEIIEERGEVMRIRRFISAMALVALVAGSAGQGAAQRQIEDRRKYVAILMAWSDAQKVIVRDLVETWEQCGAEMDREDKVRLHCDVYEEKIRRTPIEKLVRVGPAIRLPKEDMDQLKRDIISAASDAYDYGKTKGGAK